MRNGTLLASAVSIALASLLPAPTASAAEPIRVAVDLRDAPRHVFHSRETIVVAPGTLALRFAKWIPGDHGPTGPIDDLAGIRMLAGATPLAWERDPVDMYVIRTTVPSGVDRIDIAFDYLSPSESSGFGAETAGTAQLAVLSWNSAVLYPNDSRAADVFVAPSIELPAGWEAASALRVEETSGAHVAYATVSLETLVDSPVAAGRYVKTVPLAAPAGSPEHLLHVFADSEAPLAARPELAAGLQRLVPEALALFGAHHYRRYDFLLTLSDHVAHFGLAHPESSDNREPERYLLEKPLFVRDADLLAHEMVHSWNGKYRRPAGLATGDFQQPMVTDLLWVYEGLTQYLGQVLTARAGLLTKRETLDQIALQAASLAHTPGRQWRSLADVSRSAQNLYEARGESASWRRGTDFYDEGVMLWLEVDARIRQLSGGKRSIDDFCVAFYGPPNSAPEVRPYTRADVVAALNEIAPYDWEKLFAARVDALRPSAPVEGIEAAGWKLAYDDEPNAIDDAFTAEPESQGPDLRFSLGIKLTDEGKVVDVLPQSSAGVAGLAVGSELVAVNSKTYSKDVLADAIAAAKGTQKPIELLVRSADYFATVRVDYHEGEREPHLVRDASKPDWLSKILAPRTWKPPSAAQRNGSP